MSKAGKRLHPFDHVRLRPDTYIGSIVSEERELWVCEKVKAEGDPVEDVEGDEAVEGEEVPLKDKFVLKTISYNEGFERCHVELFSNAIDNKWRSDGAEIPMKKIIIELNQDEGYFSIYNDGYFISCAKETYKYKDYRTGKEITEQLYPAEMFFGEMLAGTNFENDDTRKTSGKNGIGSKATVSMSQSFIVEHSDPENGKVFYQEYSNGGKERTTPKITSYKGKTGYTKVTFYPDFKIFGLEGYSNDMIALLRRHAYDCAAFSKVPVVLNGEKLVVKDFAKYTLLYYPDTKKSSLIPLTAPNGDECVLIERDVASEATENLDSGHPAVESKDTMYSMSFVNGIYTRDDGLHVDAWKKTFLTALVQAFNARKLKKGETPVKAAIKDFNPYLSIFVRCEIEGAKFDSQSKHKLTGPKIELYSAKKKADKEKWTEMIDGAVAKVLKWGIIPILHANLDQKSQGKQSKKEGAATKKQNFGDKYQKANWAGTKRWRETCLVVSEGKSAKAFATRMFNGQFDEYGLYAIRGKFISVIRATRKELDNNVEVQELMAILGLARGTKPGERRYGRILIMTDADDDGFHIAGLLHSFLYHFWPELYEEGVVESMTTAVVIVKYKEKKEEKELIFYSNPEFNNWTERGEAEKLAKMLGISVSPYHRRHHLLQGTGYSRTRR